MDDAKEEYGCRLVSKKVYDFRLTLPVKLNDSLLLLPMSLAKLAKSFGVGAQSANKLIYDTSGRLAHHDTAWRLAHLNDPLFQCAKRRKSFKL